MTQAGRQQDEHQDVSRFTRRNRTVFGYGPPVTAETSQRGNCHSVEPREVVGRRWSRRRAPALFCVALVLTLAVPAFTPVSSFAVAAIPTFRSATAATLLGTVNFRAASSFATTSGTLAIAQPAATAVNDVMIAAIGVRPSSTTITAPAGWTLVRRINNASASSNALVVYRKVAGATEPA